MNILVKIIVYVLAVFVADWLLAGIKFETVEVGLIVAAALALVNVFIKPILLTLAFPITVITLGIFPFILNTLLIIMVSFFVQGFKIYGDNLFVFLWASAFSIVLTFLTYFMENFTGYDLPGGR